MAGMAWFIRTLSWHRRKIAAVLTALALLVVLSHLSAPAEASDHVVVTTSNLVAGQRVDTSDVDLLPLPRSAIPADTMTALDDVIGHSVAVSLSPGTTVQQGLLVAGVPVARGRSLVPITVHDAQLRSILPPGARVALVAAGPEAPALLTDGAVVHGMAAVEQVGFVASGQPALVLVEVPSQIAAEVSVLGQSGQLGIYLTG